MKKKMGILFLALSASLIFSMPVLAADDKAGGFYDIGTKENVLIKPYAGNTEATATEQDVDGDEGAEIWYIDSDRLDVSYTAATNGGYYGAFLVEGDELPTKDNEVYYADQLTAGSSVVDFNVYPLLPTETTDMTLYISSNVQDFELVKIPLNYAHNVTVIPPYTLGDIDNDGNFGVKDALIALQIGVGKYPATDSQKAAADVDKDGVCGVKDALLILQYGTGKISSFK